MIQNQVTKIYYIEGTTTGFDNGYDGEMFGATSNAFAIYTHLVGNEQGQVGNSQGTWLCRTISTHRQL